jgi:hypothetical protein
MAKYITHEEGIAKAEATDDHWKVVRLRLGQHEQLVRHNASGTALFVSRSKLYEAIGAWARASAGSLQAVANSSSPSTSSKQTGASATTEAGPERNV